MARKKKTDDTLAFDNAAKTLLANIRFASVDTPIKSITVTSSIPNEGKSTIALNLARPSQPAARAFCSLNATCATVRLPTCWASVMPAACTLCFPIRCRSMRPLSTPASPTSSSSTAEPRIPNPADIIASRRFAKLVAALEEKYQYVIFDTPPVGTFVDAAEVAAITDGTIYIIRQDICQAQ